MAFDVALPVVVALHAGTICTEPIVLPGAVSESVSLGSLITQAAYSVEAQIHIIGVYLLACFMPNQQYIIVSFPMHFFLWLESWY